MREHGCPDARLGGAVLATIFALAAVPADAQRPLARDQEFDLALTALPPPLRDGAAVYVLGPAGFELARPAANGFSCLVERDDSNTLAPICFDREGSETTLQTVLLRGRLRAAGRSEDEITRAVAEGYRAGRLLAPRRPGIAYMLSTEFNQLDPATGALQQIFPPHLMFYAPNLTNADIGASDKDYGREDVPWILGEGPEAVIIVVPKQ